MNGACCSAKSRNFTSACRRLDQPSLLAECDERKRFAVARARKRERRERIRKCAACRACRRERERRGKRKRERQAEGTAERTRAEDGERDIPRVRGKKTEALRSEKNTERPDPLSPRVSSVIASFSRERGERRPPAGTKKEERRKTGVHKRSQRKKRKKQRGDPSFTCRRKWWPTAGGRECAKTFTDGPRGAVRCGPPGTSRSRV